MKTAPERFWEKVEKTETCWLFKQQGDGRYSRFYIDGKFTLAHRVSWSIANGDIPEGMCVLHRCDVTHCVRPSHLFLGSQIENMRDMSLKGRCNPARGSSHPASKLSEENVREMRTLYPGTNTVDLSRKYGIRQSRVWLIVNRKAWTHI